MGPDVGGSSYGTMSSPMDVVARAGSELKRRKNIKGGAKVKRISSRKKRRSTHTKPHSVRSKGRKTVSKKKNKTKKRTSSKVNLSKKFLL